MSHDIDSRLEELGIVLPTPANPAANYVPYVISGNLVFIAGQIPFWNGAVLHIGKVGVELTVEDATKSAKVCGLNIIAQLKAACDGNLDRVRRCVKIGVFVNCIDGFTQQPQIANGVSDLMVDVFGEAGRHARFAIGTNALPRNCATEADAVFELS
jgi:enamine deaminase RidA (YjgF/YER057c/UK114 family)